jgi:hypothetical protein
VQGMLLPVLNCLLESNGVQQKFMCRTTTGKHEIRQSDLLPPINKERQEFQRDKKLSNLLSPPTALTRRDSVSNVDLDAVRECWTQNESKSSREKQSWGRMFTLRSQKNSEATKGLSEGKAKGWDLPATRTAGTISPLILQRRRGCLAYLSRGIWWEIYCEMLSSRSGLQVGKVCADHSFWFDRRSQQTCENSWLRPKH